MAEESKYLTEEEQEAKKGEEFAREQMSLDVRFCLDTPQCRRLLRFILGPQVTNLLGANCEERGAGVSLINELMVHEPKTMEILFASKEADENGWT